jgi:hypothetical protein
VARTEYHEVPTSGDHGAAISQYIRDAMRDGANETVLGAGEWVCQKPIEWPMEPFRLIGQGYPGWGKGAILTRNADVCILPMKGGVNATSPSDMVVRPQLENLQFDGRGFTAPLLDLTGVYEARLLSVHTEGWYVCHVYIANTWDSRFEDCTFMGGGFCNPAAVLASGLEQRVGYSVGVPMVHVDSTRAASGADTSNNLYWRGCRFESSPNNSIMLLMDGNNGVDHFFSQCKWEGLEAMRPLVLAVDQAGVDFASCWMFGAGMGRAPYEMEGVAAGTKYKTITTKHPGLLHCVECHHVSGLITGGAPDGNPAENAPFDAFIRLHGGEAAALTFNVTGGLTRLQDGGGAGIRHSGNVRYPELLASRASYWASGLAPAVPMVDQV